MEEQHPHEADPRDFLVNRMLEASGERIPFDYDEFFHSAEYEKFSRLAIGTMSVTDMKTKTRYIDHQVWPYTEWELARTYLNWIFDTQRSPRQKRIGWNKQTWNLLDMPQPLYFKAPVEGELAYVDLSAAFWQLYSPVSLDMYFNPWRQGFGVGNIKFLYGDWLRSQRTIRLAVLGITRSRQHTEFAPKHMNKPDAPSDIRTPGVDGEYSWRMRRTYNKLLAPELWGYIAFSLHHIARQLIENFDVHYVHTDGYIVPRNQAAEVVGYLGEVWEMEARIKAEGYGKAAGLGRWEIAGKGTRNYGEGSPKTNIIDRDDDFAAWLVKMRKWALTDV